MYRFDKKQVAATVDYIVYLLTQGIEQALSQGKPSRCTVEDLRAVLAEHGHQITLAPKRPTTYLTRGDATPAELYADICLYVDEAPSALILRCTLFAEQHAGRYAYQVEDLLAP
jgi:hypothetical protein